MDQRYDRTLISNDPLWPVGEGATQFLSSPVTSPSEGDTLVGPPVEPARTTALALLPRPAIGSDAAGQPAAGSAAEGATQFIGSPLALPPGPNQPSRRRRPLQAALAAGLVLVVGLGAIVARNQIPTAAEVAEPPALVEELTPDSLSEAAGAAGAVTVARLDIPLGPESGDAGAGSGPPLEPLAADLIERVSVDIATRPNPIGLDSELVGVQAERLAPAETAPAAEAAALASGDSASQAPTEAAAAATEPASTQTAEATELNSIQDAEAAVVGEQPADSGQESGEAAASLPDQASVEQAAAVVEQQTLPAQSNAGDHNGERARNGRTAISQYAPSGSAASRLGFGR